MRGSRPEQYSGQAGGIARRVVGAAVADHGAGSIPRTRVRASRPPIAAQPVEFRVIEHVERFRPEFKVLALGNREVFEQGHVEIRTPGIVQNVPSGVAEGQAPRCCEGCGIEQKGPESCERRVLDSGFWVPDKVWVRATSQATKVANLRGASSRARIVGGRDRAIARVVHTERRAALN